MCHHLSRRIPGLLLLLLLGLGSSSALLAENQEAAGRTEPEQEEESGRLGGYKLLPIPIFITEPAIGEGLGVALAIFHPVKGGYQRLPSATTPTAIGQMDRERSAPPVITAVFGAYTNNDTWAAGVGHMNNWFEDRIRYQGAYVSSRINSTFYAGWIPLKYTLEGDLLYQDIKFRLGDSSFFLGGSFSYVDADNSFNFNLDADIPIALINYEIRDVGLAVTGSYDSRDDTMNPNAGQVLDLSVWWHDKGLGGNYDYRSGKLKARAFHQFLDAIVLGIRLEVSAVDGQPPFYGYPWVKLRGIPAMRYQDEIAGALEIEGRYQLAPKWQVLAFAGTGFTDGDSPVFEHTEDIYNYGVGARYKIFEEQNVWVGMDAAKGPEEWNWYIQVGHAW